MISNSSAVSTLRLRPRPSGTPAASADAWWLDGADASVWLAAAGEASLAPATDPATGQIVGTLVLEADPRDRAVPYQRVFRDEACELLVPCDAVVDPPVRIEEWPSLLADHAVWVWHPTAGLMGYDAADLLTAEDLLRSPDFTGGGWSGARQAQPLAPRLRQVIAPPVPVDADGEQPLATLDGDGIGSIDPSSLDQGVRAVLGEAASKVLGPIARGLNRAAAAFRKKREQAAGSGPTGSKSAGNASPGGPGFAERFTAAVASRLGDLISARTRSVDQLLAKLDDDPDEGLKFALPFGGSKSPAPPGMSGVDLVRRDVNFNLGDLTGGGTGDSWQLPDDRQRQLLAKYRELAARETRLGRHRRAAYIFAQLLGDERSAASALERGGHWSEAAAMYERTRNPEKAAVCYERAGNFSRAADLYTAQRKYESLATLYERLGEADSAARAWNWAVEQLVQQGRVLHAADLLETKLQAGDQALTLLKTTLDQGATADAAGVVTHAINLHGRLGEHDGLADWLVELREKALTTTRVQQLSGAVSESIARYPQPAVREVMRETVVRLVADGLAVSGEGDTTRKSLLRALLPTAPSDTLLRRDVTRYGNDGGARRPKRKPRPKRGLREVSRIRATESLVDRDVSFLADEDGWVVVTVVHRWALQTPLNVSGADWAGRSPWTSTTVLASGIDGAGESAVVSGTWRPTVHGTSEKPWLDVSLELYADMPVSDAAISDFLHKAVFADAGQDDSDEVTLCEGGRDLDTNLLYRWVSSAVGLHLSSVSFGPARFLWRSFDRLVWMTTDESMPWKEVDLGEPKGITTDRLHAAVAASGRESHALSGVRSELRLSVLSSSGGSLELEDTVRHTLDSDITGLVADPSRLTFLVLTAGQARLFKDQTLLPAASLGDGKPDGCFLADGRAVAMTQARWVVFEPSGQIAVEGRFAKPLDEVLGVQPCNHPSEVVALVRSGELVRLRVTG